VHLETLRLYCDVVRLRSFSKGAEQNFVSQSAASQAVQQLEAQVGAALIDRTRRPFAVTPEGRSLYEACRAMLEAWDRAKSDVAAVKARVDGTVRVAAIYSVGLHDVSRPMQQFSSLYPEARVQLECLHPHKVVEAVTSGEADIGIMSYPPTDRALTVVPLREEPMAVVCHPNHRFARRRRLLPADLNGAPYVAFDRALPIRNYRKASGKPYDVAYRLFVLNFINRRSLDTADQRNLRADRRNVHNIPRQQLHITGFVPAQQQVVQIDFGDHLCAPF